MAMYYRNFTPHEICIEGYFTFRFPSEGVARVEQTCMEVGHHGGYPLRKIQQGEIIGLPDPIPAVLFIVSPLVMQANEKAPHKRYDLVSADTGETARRDANGRIVAVTGFCV